MELYRTALQQLKESEHVFACECSRAQVPDGIYQGTCRNKGLPLDKENVSWRLRTDTTKEISIQTLTGEIKAILPPSMQDFVVRKKDGFPAYQLTSVVDDHYFGVDLIIRGEDLWPSTIAQNYLSALLPGNTFQYSTSYHHPLLLETPDKKLSKSAGATSIQFLRKEEQQPADIYTMIAQMLGYGQGVKDLEGIMELMKVPLRR
jgi:glutamyl-tRNA synthetase